MTPRRRWTILAGGVATTTAVGLAAFTGYQIATTPEPTASQARGPEERRPSSDLVEFRDPQTGYAVSYPGDWIRVESPEDPEVHLRMALNERESHSFLVRVVPLGVQVQPDDVPAMASITNSVVTSGEGVNVLIGPEQVEMGGLPGLGYRYTFTDETGEQGSHSHFFLFKDDKMISMVFQALPEDGFDQLAPTFNKIADSFRVLP